MPPVIQANHLCRSFNGFRAVDDLSLEVPAGAVFGFLGPNGAGKTTTIRMMLGLLEPTAGDIRVLGFDARTQADRVRERVGVLLDNDGLYDRLTAYDNLDYFGRIYRLPGIERATRIQQLLEHLGLWEHRREKAKVFSRGMRQKLALARALLHRPPLLILDEPTTGLDAPSAVALREDLLNLARSEGVTVFLTTHNLAEAEKVCDRVAVIQSGHVLAEGSPADLSARVSRPRVEIAGRGFDDGMLAVVRQNPLVERVTIDDKVLIIDLKVEGSIAPIVTLLATRGAEIEEVRKHGAGLEEAFISLLTENEQ
ncbi:MAG: ABC transporter ATP-binding protein [Ignavibacteriales bacterium]